MQVTLRSSSKQRQNSLNSTRTPRKGISLTKKSISNSTQKDKSQILIQFSKNQFNSYLNNNQCSRNNIEKHQTIFEQNRIKNEGVLNKKITFKYTNNIDPSIKIFQNPNDMRRNRFINYPVQQIKSEYIIHNVNQSIKKLPQSKVIIEKRPSSLIKIQQNKNTFSQDQSVRNQIILSNNDQKIYNDSIMQKKQNQKVKCLIDSRIVPRMINFQEHIILPNKQILSKSRIQKEFTQNQQQKRQINLINTAKYQNSLNRLSVVRNQVRIQNSPYHMLASTAKKIQNDHYLSLSKKVKPFQMLNVQQTTSIELLPKKQLIQSSQLKVCSVQTIKIESVQPQILINNDQNKEQKDNIYSIKTQKQISKSPKKNSNDSPSRSTLKKIQNIENIMPSRGRLSQVRPNNKRIKQIQKRLQQIISICNNNL